MKRFLLLLFVISLLAPGICANDEKPMKKKEMKELVAIMKNYLSSSNYEEALNLYQQNEVRLNVKSLSKTDKLWWDTLVVVLSVKNSIFNENHKQINKAYFYLNNFEFRKCSELAQRLSLDKTCAYRKDIDELNNINTLLVDKREFMNLLDDSMHIYAVLYQSKKYEELFHLLNTEHLLGYVSSENMDIMTEIYDSVASVHKGYKLILGNTVSITDNLIETASDIQGFKSAKHFLSSVLYQISLIENYNYGMYSVELYPTLHNRTSKALSDLRRTKVSLETYIKENDPQKLIFSSAPLTEKQIASMCEDVIPDFHSIMKLDVIKYYNMHFDSELKKQNYMSSPDYSQYLSELKAIKADALKSVYYQTIDVNTGNFDLEDNCFYVEIGTNSGTIIPVLNVFEVYPAGAIGKEDNKIVHDALKISAFKDRWIFNGYRNGDKFSRYYLSIPVDKTKAEQYEKKKCTLIICFTPNGMKQYKYTGVNYDGRSSYDVYDIKREFPYTSTCRVLLVTYDGEIIYDKVLKK